MTSGAYVPARRDVIRLDFEPVKGREIGELRPAIILSSEEYNRKTGLLICCPISTQVRGAPTEVPLRGLEHPSVIVASMVLTLAWRERRATKITRASSHTYRQTLFRLLPLLGAADVLGDA